MSTKSPSEPPEQDKLEPAAGSDDESGVLVRCDQCGRTNLFPPIKRGKVEQCEHCNSYLDV